MPLPMLTAEEAARAVKAGSVVAYPTETVYGLAVMADDEKAVAELRRVKGLKETRGISLLVADNSWIERYAQPPGDIIRRLMESYWPGPLTLVLDVKPGIFAEGVAAPDGTVGFRLTPNMEALRFISLVDRPITSTSANPSGITETCDAQEVMRHFDGKIAGILEGSCGGQKASTVVRVRGGAVDILREGPIPAADILRICGVQRA